MGFLGVMKISGNLNRLFFVELIMALPGEKKHHTENDSSAQKVKKKICLESAFDIIKIFM